MSVRIENITMEIPRITDQDRAADRAAQAALAKQRPEPFAGLADVVRDHGQVGCRRRPQQ